MAQTQQPAFAITVRDVYDVLDAVYHDAVWHWMPTVAGDPMDIIAGAVLVQHTTWVNAERALTALRTAGVLDATPLARTPEVKIAALVRVSGTPSIKARRLRAMAETIVRAGGLGAFLALPLETLRSELLATHGVGPETADDIVLYAAGQPVFIIDAYTRRLFRRLGLGPEGNSYDTWQRYFEDALGERGGRVGGQLRSPAIRKRLLDLYRRYHGYIVLHAKATCRAVPRCAPCPLLARCPEGRARIGASTVATRASALPATS